jgi:hypothetical protein
VKYRAAVDVPYNDPDQARATLRAQLRIMAVAWRLVPDWETLRVDGPAAWPDGRGQTWFEFTATVLSHQPR